MRLNGLSLWKDHHVVEDESGEYWWNANDSENRRAVRETRPSATWSIASFLKTTTDIPSLAPDGRSVRSGAVKSTTIIIIILNLFSPFSFRCAVYW